MAMQYMLNIPWWYRMSMLSYNFLRSKGKEQQCDICDQLVSTMLDLEDHHHGPQGKAAGSTEELPISCSSMCPFRITKCMDMCEKLAKAATINTKFPCEAIGVCPKLDADGELPVCVWDKKARECTPHAFCTLTRRLPYPKCQPRSGYKKWTKVTRAISANVEALVEAVHTLPKCGEPGSHDLFCVAESSVTSTVCEYIAYVLVSVVATYQSVRAIQTEGGNDDRQWLTFWMIYFVFACVERFTSVVLSWITVAGVQVYYVIKLALLVWLMFCDGSLKVYRWCTLSFRYCSKNSAIAASIRGLKRWTGILDFEFLLPRDTPLSTQEYLNKMNAETNQGILLQKFVRICMSKTEQYRARQMACENRGNLRESQELSFSDYIHRPEKLKLDTIPASPLLVRGPLTPRSSNNMSSEPLEQRLVSVSQGTDAWVPEKAQHVSEAPTTAIENTRTTDDLEDTDISISSQDECVHSPDQRPRRALLSVDRASANKADMQEGGKQLLALLSSREHARSEVASRPKHASLQAEVPANGDTCSSTEPLRHYSMPDPSIMKDSGNHHFSTASTLMVSEADMVDAFRSEAEEVSSTSDQGRQSGSSLGDSGGEEQTHDSPGIHVRNCETRSSSPNSGIRSNRSRSRSQNAREEHTVNANTLLSLAGGRVVSRQGSPEISHIPSNGRGASDALSLSGQPSSTLLVQEFSENDDLVHVRGFEDAMREIIFSNVRWGSHSEMVELLQTRHWQELEPRWLEIGLESGEDLPALDSNGFSDPWVLFHLVNLKDKASQSHCLWNQDESWAMPEWGDCLSGGYVDKAAKAENRVKSHVISRTLNPVWDQHMDLELRTGTLDKDGNYINEAAPYHLLVGTVYDKDYIGNDLMGVIQIPLAVLMDGERHSFKCQIMDRENPMKKAQGFVNLNLRLGC